jgi:hypothetical protein
MQVDLVFRLALAATALCLVARCWMLCHDRLCGAAYEREKRALNRWNYSDQLQRQDLIFGLNQILRSAGAKEYENLNQFEATSFYRLPWFVREYLYELTSPQPVLQTASTTTQTTSYAVKPAAT